MIILLAMAVGGVVGFEIGQHLARKQFSEFVNEALEAAKKQADEQQREREKRLEEIQENAKRLKERWEEAFKNLLNPDGKGTVTPLNTIEENEKEQKKDGI